MLKLNNKKLQTPALLGMVHVRPLPGTPFYENNLDEVVKIAVDEAKAYQKAGFTGILLENMFDRPYLKCHVGPEIVAAMTRVACEVRNAVGKDFPIGIQILAGANKEGYHYINTNFGVDYTGVVADIASAAQDYKCPECGQPLNSSTIWSGRTIK